jgi:ferric-dicitrate binding protein FerR (iron transport regulator)
VWGPIKYQGYNVEADAAWAWLQRERQHDRAQRRAKQMIAQFESSLPQADRSAGLLPKMTRRLGRPK